MCVFLYVSVEVQKNVQKRTYCFLSVTGTSLNPLKSSLNASLKSVGLFLTGNSSERREERRERRMRFVVCCYSLLLFEEKRRETWRGRGRALLSKGSMKGG